MSLIPASIRKSENKAISILVDAFSSVMDVLRLNDFDEFTEDVAKIYGIVTGNAVVFADSVSDGASELAVKFRPELRSFVHHRVIYLIDSVIKLIEGNDIIGLPREYHRADPPKWAISMRDLQLFEFEVLQMCEQAAHYIPSDTPDQRLDNSGLGDLPKILQELISEYRSTVYAIKNRNFSPDSKIRGKLSVRPDDEFRSIGSLVVIGYLIAKVATRLLIVKGVRDEDFSRERNQADTANVFSEFASFSNLGTMSFAGILCCFKNLKALPAAVLNPDGRLGNEQKKLLLNLLVIDKMT